MRSFALLLSDFRSGAGLRGQLLRGGAWGVGIRLLSALVAMLLSVVLARTLGPDGLGIYAFAFALVTILTIPAHLGLPDLVVRETAAAQKAGNWGVMGGIWFWSSAASLAMSIAIVGIGALLLWLFADRLGPHYAETLWWGLPLVPLLAFGQLRGAALRGLRKVPHGHFPELVLRPLLLILALTAFYYFGMPLSPNSAMMLHVVAAIITFGVGGAILFLVRPRGVSEVNSLVFKQRYWLTSAIPLLLVSGLDVLSQNIGLVVLGIFGSIESVALFRVAMQVSLFVGLGQAITRLVIAPYYTILHADNNQDKQQRLVLSVAQLTFTTTLFASVVIWAFGPQLIAMAFGDSFLGAYVPLCILLLGQVALGFGSPTSVLLTMTGYEKETATAAGIGLAIITIGTLALVPLYGAIGAAAAWTAGVIIWQAFMWQKAASLIGIECTAWGKVGFLLHRIKSHRRL
ncbi:oligosaccharide flippase family protein [Pelagibacterium flavum]|uniref:Oligosaccharide flippase family protein n=1 Tax=Pelagibacterium flavum TaxID=2984530 RepID=A0ABY6IPQ6_9HYPH|nr:oligosaccharide flippase family protein [Pelagibacterium sp. YIM 151497]UYQ72586.1 oligosaccharide flippase family protein [Pelagibacterium sp. YIM 151497]